MKLLVDMNLSPRWVGLLAGAGIEAAHWSTLGPNNAPDSQIMAFEAANDYVVLRIDPTFLGKGYEHAAETRPAELDDRMA